MRRNLEESREFYKGDRYASLTGIVIDEVGEGYAKCTLKIEDCHRNGRNSVQGGAIFTLADFCYGVAVDGKCVSLSSEITFLAATKGSYLYAEAKMVKTGRSTVFYTIEVTDDLGKKIAFVTMTGFRVEE